MSTTYEWADARYTSPVGVESGDWIGHNTVNSREVAVTFGGIVLTGPKAQVITALEVALQVARDLTEHHIRTVPANALAVGMEYRELDGEEWNTVETLDPDQDGVDVNGSHYLRYQAEVEIREVPS